MRHDVPDHLFIVGGHPFIVILNMNENIKEKYRHFKGGEYEVLGIAKHSENLEEFVVYRALYGESKLWVRPKEMFFDKKEIDGVLIHGFVKIEKS